MARYWVVGGYGEVGAAAVKRLVTITHDGDEILVAGRNGEKAAELAHSFGPKVRAFELDVNGAVRPNTVVDGDVVINMVESISDDWLAEMARVGTRFIDVSATESYLKRIQAFFVQHAEKSFCLTEIGTSPGLTNLMAAHLMNKISNVDRLYTYIEMGMGKHHGYAATKWFLEALSSAYRIEEDGAYLEVLPRQHIVQTDFKLPAYRKVTSIGVGFSDQIAIAKRYGLQTAKTYVSVAPNWVNVLLAACQRLPLHPSIHRNAGSLATLIGKFPPVGPIGTSVKSVAISFTGEILGTIEVRGPDQSELTGDIAAIAAHIAQTDEKNGVLSLPDVIDLRQIQQHLPQLVWHESEIAV
jgi:saccharopine dehydrogenase-like NADP-dependent oxidoreductase